MKKIILILMFFGIIQADADFALGRSSYHIDHTSIFSELTNPTVRCDGDKLFLYREVADSTRDELWTTKQLKIRGLPDGSALQYFLREERAFFVIRKSGYDYYADTYTKSHSGVIQPTENLAVCFPETRSKWLSYKSWEFQDRLCKSSLVASIGLALIIAFYDNVSSFRVLANILGYTFAGIGIFGVINSLYEYSESRDRARRLVHVN